MKKLLLLLALTPSLSVAQVSVTDDEIKVGGITVNDSGVSIGDMLKVDGGNVDIDTGNVKIKTRDSSGGNETSNGSRVEGKSFINDDLENMDFSGQNLRNALFMNVDISNVNFEGADLSGAKFKNADLLNVNMTNAMLTNVCFHNVDVVNTKMLNANLSGSAMVNTDFENVDFTGAVRDDLVSACGDINKNAASHSHGSQETERPKLTSAAEIVSSLSKSQGTIDLTVNFLTDSDKLFGNAHAQVTEIAKAINSQQLQGKSIEIQGHTDSEGEPEYNFDLSYRRAATVQKTLIKDFGVDISQLTVKGFGESQPVANNDHASGRAINRRVTLAVK